jgi:hypothetical protein
MRGFDPGDRDIVFDDRASGHHELIFRVKPISRHPKAWPRPHIDIDHVESSCCGDALPVEPVERQLQR